MADMKRSIAFLFVLSFVLLVPSDVRAQFDKAWQNADVVLVGSRY